MERNKKGQEEMVGFVLIVVMLVAMGLVFMFMIRPKTEARQDLQTENLLFSILESTSGSKSLRVMVEDCVNGVGCSETRQEFENRLDVSLKSSGLVLNRTLNGYSLTAGDILNITQGNMTGNLATAISSLQNTDVILKFYYK